MPEQDEAERLWERYEENLHLSPYIGQKQSLLALIQEERRAEREAIMQKMKDKAQRKRALGLHAEAFALDEFASAIKAGRTP
jgi:hypothetical protein